MDKANALGYSKKPALRGSFPKKVKSGLTNNICELLFKISLLDTISEGKMDNKGEII